MLLVQHDRFRKFTLFKPTTPIRDQSEFKLEGAGDSGGEMKFFRTKIWDSPYE